MLDSRPLHLIDVELLNAADDEKVRNLQECKPRDEHEEDLSEDRVGKKPDGLLFDAFEKGCGFGHGASFSTGTASMWPSRASCG